MRTIEQIKADLKAATRDVVDVAYVTEGTAGREWEAAVAMFIDLQIELAQAKEAQR